MRTTAEQRAVIREELRAYGPGGDLLDDLDEALAQLRASHEVLADLRAMTLTSQREVALLAEVTALRAVAEAAREHVLRVDGRAALVKLAPQICLDEAGWTSETLRQALDAVSKQYAAEDALRDALRAWEGRR